MMEKLLESSELGSEFYVGFLAIRKVSTSFSALPGVSLRLNGRISTLKHPNPSNPASGRPQAILVPRMPTFDIPA